MHLNPSTITSVLFTLALLALTGCAGTTQPSRFYMLNTIPEEGAPPAPGLEGEAIALGVGPVTLPPYLDRPQIVTRSATNELELGEFDRWGEPLSASFSRVLAENLAFLLDTEQVAIHPWQRSTPIDYQVSVRVLRFDSSVSGDIVLRTLWRLLRDDGRELVFTRKADFSESAGSSGDYAAMVAAQSRVIDQLSREIAKDILELHRRQRSVGATTNK
jgi:uncharacterized lipoprotein YmbA